MRFLRSFPSHKLRVFKEKKFFTPWWSIQLLPLKFKETQAGVLVSGGESKKEGVRVRLDTAENWKLKLKTEKHYSKIIFKCVNSTVGPIFNKKVAEKWNLWVREQCIVCTNWLKIVWQVKLCGYYSCTVHEQ